MFGKYYYSQADFVEAANAGRMERELQARLEQVRSEGCAEGQDECILTLLRKNYPIKEIAEWFDLTSERVEKVARENNLPLV